MIFLALWLAHQSTLTVLFEHGSQNSLAFLVQTAISFAKTHFLHCRFLLGYQVSVGQIQGMDHSSAEARVKLFVYKDQLEFVRIGVELPCKLGSEFMESEIGWDFHQHSALVDIEVVDNSESEALAEEESADCRLSINTCLLGLVEKT